MWRKQQMPSTAKQELVCVVAILKAEEPFINEWIAYHRIIGVDHFFLYDNDPSLPLKHLLKGHAEYVTVVDWPGEHEELPGRNKQTKAYTDSLRRINHRWVAFIDGDEFIVLRKHPNLKEFLVQFEHAGAVLLTWHLFGNNGYYANPKGLITASLTRRRREPGRMPKSINKVKAILSIENAHTCRLKRGFKAVDANKRRYSEILYPGKTEVAHINHYMCRSFENWMNRVERGGAAYSKENYPKNKDHRWRFERELCESKFYELEKQTNELIDEFMLKYSEAILAFVKSRETDPTPIRENLAIPAATIALR
jgi:hypothetical protein